MRDNAVVEGALNKGAKTFVKFDIVLSGAAGNLVTPAPMSSNGLKSVVIFTSEAFSQSVELSVPTGDVVALPILNPTLSWQVSVSLGQNCRASPVISPAAGQIVELRISEGAAWPVATAIW